MLFLYLCNFHSTIDGILALLIISMGCALIARKREIDLREIHRIGRLLSEIFRAGICSICALFNKTGSGVMRYPPDNSANGFIVLAKCAKFATGRLMDTVRRK